MIPFLLIPVLAAPALGSDIPQTLEIRRGTFVLKGYPGPAHIAAMKQAGITHVICICRDGDPGFNPNEENLALSEAGISFSRVALNRAPTGADFELYRMIRNGLPPFSRVLTHCTDGNRAAAVVVAWLAVEGKIKREEAIDVARRAGVVHAETEASLKTYLKL
jgi:protein tyrosine phosphatase (PTP) superfamily phosphohydrolase (DUF442 family)